MGDLAFILPTRNINQYRFPVYGALISVTYINDNRNNKIFCQLYMLKLNFCLEKHDKCPTLELLQ